MACMFPLNRLTALLGAGYRYMVGGMRLLVGVWDTVERVGGCGAVACRGVLSVWSGSRWQRRRGEACGEREERSKHAWIHAEAEVEAREGVAGE